MATISPHSIAPSSRPGRSPEFERVLRSLERCLGADGRFVLLDASRDVDRAAALTELAAALPSEVRALRIVAEAGPAFDPAARLLEELDPSAGGSPREALGRTIERMRADGTAVALFVDAADTLSPESIRWLVELSEREATRCRLLLAAADHARIVAALEGRGACVSLVRFEGPTLESSAGVALASPSLRVAAAAASEGAEVEALGAGVEIADAGLPTWFGFVSGVVISFSFFIGIGFAFVTSERITSSAVESAAPAARATVTAEPSAVEPSAAEPSAANTDAAESSAAETEVATIERPFEPPLEGGSVAPSRQVGVVVSDTRHAVELLSDEDAGGSHAAAEAFLRARGPDPAGYELLAELDARRASDPTETAHLLAARARVRSALCAAWADDVLGEAPLRLGCPGADSATR